MTAIPTQVQDVMSPDPVCVGGEATLRGVAYLMRERDVGDVLIVDHHQVTGVITDRDLVVRGLAQNLDPDTAQAGAVCSEPVVTVAPDDPVATAVQLMRDHAVRRLPVVQDGKPVGVVSLGDLALTQDPRSALADISAVAPNR